MERFTSTIDMIIMFMVILFFKPLFYNISRNIAGQSDNANVEHTGNASRNLPNTMCGLVGTFLISVKMFLIPCVLWAISGTIFNMFLIPNNIRNNLSVPDIMRNHFTMFLIWRCLFSLYDNLLVI